MPLRLAPGDKIILLVLRQSPNKAVVHVCLIPRCLVATMPDYQSNRTSWHCDGLRYPKLLYAEIENHVRKYIVKQPVTFLVPSPKSKETPCSSVDLTYQSAYYAAAVAKLC